MSRRTIALSIIEASDGHGMLLDEPSGAVAYTNAYDTPRAEQIRKAMNADKLIHIDNE